MTIKTFDLKEVAHLTEEKDGLLLIVEAYKDLGKADDDELRALRGVMIGKHEAQLTIFSGLGDDRYSTPEGNAALRDLAYYGNCISRLESEMQYRMMTLD